MPDTRNSFSLNGPSRALDPRVNAMRGDLADVVLAGRHFSPHYARAVERFCGVACSAILDLPDGRQVSELLMGECFMLLDESGGWAWGYSKHDHYVGYVHADALTNTATSAAKLPMQDIVEAARTFLDRPYLWGGRGGRGIDCSGLVQRSLAAAGVAVPRDSDMQMAVLGSDLPEGVPLQRGDLVFFPGHVGIMVDAHDIIHATQHFGRTVIEPLADVVSRIGEHNDEPVIARRRVAS